MLETNEHFTSIMKKSEIDIWCAKATLKLIDNMTVLHRIDFKNYDVREY
jgi:hypothetical protein